MAELSKKAITEELTAALKQKDAVLAGTLRLLLAAVRNREIEKKGKGDDIELSREELLELVSRECKKREEAIILYEKGNRNDLAEKEKQELAILKRYLPEPASREEIESIINSVIEELKPAGLKDMGRVMSEIMKVLKYRADAGEISKLVREKLTNAENKNGMQYTGSTYAPPR